MTNKWKSAFWVALVIILVLGTFLIAKIFTGPSIEHQYAFSIQVQVPGDFACVLSPNELILKKGEVGTITITNTASGGFDANIQFKISGLPDGSYSFSVNPVAVGQTTVLTIQSSLLASETGYACQLIASSVI